MKNFFAAATAIVILCAGVLGAGFLSSRRLSVEEYVLREEGIRIAHLSDLHIPKLGVKTEEITENVRAGKPDIIVVTGDVFDGSAEAETLTEVKGFYAELVKTAPVYAVIGNHEIGSPLLGEYVELCRKTGVRLMSNSCETALIRGRRICICGVKDGCLPKNELPENMTKILLAHRPEKIKDYAEFDVVFAGHAHGGQIRFFSRGLYAPDQGYFPEYTSGKYVYGDTQMFVSRGLGDGNNKLRIFNSYNLIFVSL